jgi:hypothetical protein
LTNPHLTTGTTSVISARMTVLMRNDDGTTRDWGLVGVVFDFPAVMLGSNSSALEQGGYSYRISKLNNTTGAYESLVSKEYEDGNDAVVVGFAIRDVQFRLSAYPTTGWVNVDKVVSSALLLLGLALALGFLSCLS